MTEARGSETAPLPEPVRARVISLAADALGQIPAEALPGPLRRVVTFAPARRAKLAGSQIAAVLANDASVREQVAAQLRVRLPALTEALEGGATPQAADPVELSALAYLLRPPGWETVLASSVEVAQLESTDAANRRAVQQVERLRGQVDSTVEELKEAKRRHRAQVAELKAENADLRRKLGEARSRVRTAETEARTATAAAEQRVSGAAAANADHEAEMRRVRTRVEELERELAALRRTERSERGTESMRARLLLDTLLETVAGLRRELALPAVEGSPADLVEAHVAEEGERASSAHSSMRTDDPALLDQLLALPRVHLVVDGYNVTKAAWPDLSLERQRDRLVTVLAPLAARSGAEVTVVFDAAETTERPLVSRPRGVRVLYSPVGVIADEVIRDLVAAEPRGRPVVVVSSDQEVVRDVTRSGARVAAAQALSRLLARS